MAHHVEPMDIDSDFDNKENSLHHSNVLPFTEKGYEELDVSELNMKLRYSLTPVSSPMSKSYTVNCLDNRSLESGDDSLNNTVNENTNLTRSLNSTITKNDNVLKSLKALPLQTIQTEQVVDNNRESLLKPLEPFLTPDNGNINITITTPSDPDENLSLPSCTSSALQTPEATTPTKEVPPKDDGSPIMRGLKSVLNMFRSSQSPIPPADNENPLQPSISDPNESSVLTCEYKSEQVLASTPISACRKKEMSPTKRSSPLRDSSLVFNQNLEKELHWKDETTIIFSQERIPIHKLLLQQPQTNKKLNVEVSESSQQEIQELNSTIEYMDISQNLSTADSTMTDIQSDTTKADNTLAGDSDTEFVDCETTFTKNESLVLECKDKTPMVDNQDLDLTKDVQYDNESGSRLREIILNTTQDILDATLSIRPEDLLPGEIYQTSDMSQEFNNIDTVQSTIDITTPSAEEIKREKTNPIKITADSSEQTCSEDKTKSHVEKNVDGTQALSNQSDITENLNIAITNETVILQNKTCNVEVTTRDDSTENDDLSTIGNKSVPSELTNNGEPTVTLLTSCIDLVSTPLLVDVEVNRVKKVSLELPYDIPLPEEDLDKYSIENIHPVNETQKLVNVNEMKMTEEMTDTNVVNKVDLKNVKNEEALKKVEEIVLSDNSTCVTDIVNNNNNQRTVPNNVKESQQHLKPETKQIEVNEYSVQIKQVIENQLSKPMNTNQINNALPDIVNQTIQTNIQSSEDSQSKSDAKPDDIVNLTTKPCEDVLKNFKMDLQTQNFIPKNDPPIIESMAGNTSVLHTGSPGVPIVTENQPQNDYSRSIISRPEDIDKKLSVTLSLENPQGTEETDISLKVDAKAVDEELALSESDSPFVSVTIGNIPENINEDLEHSEVAISLPEKDKVIITPPNSPPIRSKGYNFNFDDIEFDPFATKTNIRMSPPLDLPQKSDMFETEIKCSSKSKPKKDFNRRKTQFQNRKPTAPKRKFNSTFNGTINVETEKQIENIEEVSVAEVHLDVPVNIALTPKNVTIDENDTKMHNVDHILQENLVCNKAMVVGTTAILADKIEHPIESAAESSYSTESNQNELTATSSSEQSTYFSAGTSSSDSSIPSRNVFNLPEIDDRNFNPFATKCKMRQSPPPSLDTGNMFTVKSEIENTSESPIVFATVNEEKTTLCIDKNETELMEKDASNSLSDSTVSSKATDERNVTTREIHTEDEDTIEGPFFEADDITQVYDDKMSALSNDNSDMIQFNELPIQNCEENPFTDEMFIDAEAFEFLLNQNKSNTVVDSGKESLFLKFDPLFAKRMSALTPDGVVASLAKLQRKNITLTKELQPQTSASSTTGTLNINVTRDDKTEDLNDESNITVSKPMMVVPPAVNPVTPKNEFFTPSRSNRRSFTFTSPAVAVIDRLLSLSGNSSQGHASPVTLVSREQNEADVALSQLRDLLAEKEINVYNLRSESNELRDRLNTLESHVKTLEMACQDKLNKIAQLNETLAEKTKINKSMATVVEEYERTIASLIAETAQDKKKHAEERMKLINERDEQTAHLASMEVSFSDLHSKYEKSKQVILQCKATEDIYKKSIKEFEENLAKMQNNYELLKQHATSKLNHANQELEKMNKSHEAEVLKLNAMIKRKDLHITSLEESLAQKTKANEELTAICDELINKVG